MEQALYFLLYGGLGPVITTAVAETEGTREAQFVVVAAVVRTPVRRVAQHFELQRLAHLRRSHLALVAKDLAFYAAQSKNRFPIGERKPGADLQDCKMVLHHLC